MTKHRQQSTRVKVKETDLTWNLMCSSLLHSELVRQHTYTWMYITLQKSDRHLKIYRQWFMNIQGRGILFKYSHHCLFLFSIVVLQILVLKNLRKEGKKNISYWWPRDFTSCFSVQFSSVAQSCLTLCDPMNAGRQASLSITNSQSPPKPMSIEVVMPSNHLILCRPLLLLPSIFPSIRVFSNESALCIRWPILFSIPNKPSR